MSAHGSIPVSAFAIFLSCDIMVSAYLVFFGCPQATSRALRLREVVQRVHAVDCGTPLPSYSTHTTKLIIVTFVTAAFCGWIRAYASMTDLLSYGLSFDSAL